MTTSYPMKIRNKCSDFGCGMIRMKMVLEVKIAILSLETSIHLASVVYQGNDLHRDEFFLLDNDAN